MKYKQKNTEKLPKKNNATDGKKAHNDSVFYKIGKIRYGSWANKILKAYDIVVSERDLVHIQNEHNTELEAIGLTAFDFVKYIADNFNKIYKGSGNSVLLVVWREKTSYTAAIELYLTKQNDVYKIKTALPMNTVTLSKKKLFYANVR